MLSRQKLGLILENKVVQKLEFSVIFDVDNFPLSNLIYLIAVEVGINVEGVQKLQNQ